jgi:hypothetical protein
VINVADKNCSTRGLCLGMALEAEIRVALHQHFGVNGTVRIVADGAAFTHRRVLENEWPRLFTMALGAIFIEPRHGETPGGFHDIHAVRIVALDATHFAFNDRVMLRKVEFSAGFLMALEAGFGVFAGIDDEFFQAAAPRHGDVLAPWSVAGFTALLAVHFCICQMQAGMGAGWEDAGYVPMAIGAGFIADVGCAFDLRRREDGAAERCAGV